MKEHTIPVGKKEAAKDKQRNDMATDLLFPFRTAEGQPGGEGKEERAVPPCRMADGQYLVFVDGVVGEYVATMATIRDRFPPYLLFLIRICREKEDGGQRLASRCGA